jgi:hypothetical protein
VADWLLNLPVSWMALIVFVATYLIAGGVYLVVTKLAVTEWARAFKAVSPAILPPLGILFALLVGFIAVDVWNNFDKAKAAVATEASALRAVVLLAGTFPEEQKARFYALTSKRSGLCQSVGSLRSLAALINVANGHPRSKGTEVFAPDHAIL